MTRKQLLVAAVLVVVALAAIVVAYAFLPADAAWRTNRLLHHAAQAAAGLAALGGAVWAFWPRPAPRRRDLARLEAHRRVLFGAALVLVTVAWVALTEVWRDRVARSFLEPARTDLAAVASALDAYAADHAGNLPAAIQDLAPDYLPRERLYYVHRDGPLPADPPQAEADPSYAFVKPKVPQTADRPLRREETVRAYLRSGQAWAPLTVVADKAGHVRIVGEDLVTRFEQEP